MRESIARFPATPTGGTPDFQIHLAAAASNRNLEHLRATSHDGGDRRSWPAATGRRAPPAAAADTDVYGRMCWDRPAPALMGRCYSVSNGRYGHPVQSRAVSLPALVPG